MSQLNHQSENINISEKVMSAIKNGRVLMRPKWQFILEATLGALGVAVILLALVYFISFIIFILRQSGAWFTPAFGARGWFEFLFALPWVLIILALICFIILEILVRRYSFAYRRPVVYSLFGVVLLALVGGSLVARTSFHNNLWRESRTNRLSAPAGGFYRQFGRPHRPNIERGVIYEITQDGFYLKDESADDLIKVIVDGQTNRPEIAEFKVGDMVVVMGKKNEEEIKALGVHIINGEFDMMPPPMMPGVGPGRRGLRPPPPFGEMK